MRYADPGYQPDRRPRYDITTKAKIRAAWAYINRPAYAAKYTREQLRLIHMRIRRAGKAKGIEFGHTRQRGASALEICLIVLVVIVILILVGVLRPH